MKTPLFRYFVYSKYNLTKPDRRTLFILNTNNNKISRNIGMGDYESRLDVEWLKRAIETQYVTEIGINSHFRCQECQHVLPINESGIRHTICNDCMEKSYDSMKKSYDEAARARVY